MGWFCSECRRFRRVAGRFEAGDGVVVAVVDNVGNVDGGCAGVVSNDVADIAGVDRLVGVSLACMPVSQVLGSSVDVPASFSRRGGSSLGAVCITASTVVVGVVWVLESVVSRVVGSGCASSLSLFVSHFSRSATLPRSSPSFSPFSYPFSLSIFPISDCVILATVNALVNPSFAFRNPSSRPRFMISS